MRILFIGDSLTQGYLDQSFLGWPGRVAARCIDPSHTVYNLGIRGNATPRIAERFDAETSARMTDEPTLFVLCFGTADTVQQYPPEQSLEAARELLTKAGKMGKVLFLTPPPVVDAERTERVSLLAEAFRELCEELSVPCFDLFTALKASEDYFASLERSDMVHPDARGYEIMADIIAGWDKLQQALA